MTNSSFDTLPISNDFMFKKVMENERLCKKLVGAIMQKKIADIIYTETEKTIELYYDSRGVRLDVIIADEKRTRYNLEMQVKNTLGDTTGEPVLPKRTRYYQSIMDMDMLQKGQDFDELNPLVLVFICAFDFFNEGRYVYTFKSRCLENLALELKNDVTVMLLNSQGTHGDVTPQVKNFLRYVNENVPTDEFTQEVQAEVIRLRQDKKARREYMVLSTRLKDERMEGRKEGRIDMALKMLKCQEPASKIIAYSDLSKEEVYALAQANGLEVVE
ncbi:MAG: Rpn family recombination-promoting nuclease/putative transposase [Phascolarctobacterium sp.]|uniref:Rpn family recombination-promoting nuclease/putative transposase n=1 Tax=Phascolarctobacterium sp. TaxID=2049039 RepID=UPI0026DC2404|nr:Rpn family recombination-promoting nuclease/putative transposase [Phascolarctobacterium sp.]MDO4921340.1 Rpn family recombination-promoting nuclease/putative transposase [Phascolarctobacterium sp.]